MNTVSLPLMFPCIADPPSSREARLDALAWEVHHLEASLKAELAIYPESLAKWEWPAPALALVEELRKLAKKNEDLVRGPMDDLLAWPDAKSADPQLFYGGKEGFETFYRSKNWFEEMGFDKYETMYTFSDAWDKCPIEATILVPRGLRDGTRVRVMWVWHGGGFCTGSGDFIPWYSRSSIEYARCRNAIIIAPNYPLGPEANYRDICAAIKDFLHWYKYDGCFEPGFQSWTTWLTETAQLQHVIFEKHYVIMEGESAGGLAAIIAMFMNADKTAELGIPIDAILLRYPMVRHYTRKFPPNGMAMYMNRLFTQDEVTLHAKTLVDAVHQLETQGLVPTRTSDSAPRSMSAAFLLSMSGLWQSSFQRAHMQSSPTKCCATALPPPSLSPLAVSTAPAPHNSATDFNTDSLDAIQRAHLLTPTTVPSLLPPLIIYHAHDDLNCAFADTQLFVDTLLKQYPCTYREDETVFLKKVTRLEGKLHFHKDKAGKGKGKEERNGSLERIQTENVGHGFDYDLEVDKEDWLGEAYRRVDRFWSEELD